MKKTNVYIILLITVFLAVVVPKPYKTDPGFVTKEDFERFEKSKKKCFGYSIDAPRDSRLIDDAHYRLCFGVVVAQSTFDHSSVTPVVITESPTISPTVSQQPTSTTKPVATKKPVKVSPTPITGVDLRFVDVHFEPQPEPNTGYTPFRATNGGSITVANEKHVSEFKLFAVYVNYGTVESKNVWMHYFIDGVEVKKGLAYLPGNMIADELVTTDSAQPVMIPASGTHVIKIVIDPDNESKDVNVSNNTYTFTYRVQ